jgi:hypothetical protein
MKKKYIKPQIKEIKIDQEISLRLGSTLNDDLVSEPGSGGAGLGGEGNSSGETTWERTSYSAPKDPFGTNIWDNEELGID